MKILHERNFMPRYIILLCSKKKQRCSIRFMRIRRETMRICVVAKQDRHNPRQWKKKTIISHSYIAIIKVSREKKRNDIYDEKCTSFVCDFNFKTGYGKYIVFYVCTYLYESTKILHTLVWIIHRKYMYTHITKKFLKSTVYAYFYPWFLSFFLCIRYARIASYCYALTKSLHSVLLLCNRMLLYNRVYRVI